MDLVDVALVHRLGLALLHHLDRPPDDDVQPLAVRHQPDVIVEHAARVEQRDREAHRLLEHELELVDRRVPLRPQLVVQLVLAEREHGHQVRAAAHRQLHEPLAPLQHQPQRPRQRVERLARPADDDGHGAAHPFAVGPAAGQDVLARLARHGGEPHGERVVAVQRDAEVGVQGQQGVGYAGEELGEAHGFGGEGGEGAVRDDAVRVVAEDVLAGWGERGGAVEAGGEVGGEERPEGEGAEEGGAVGQLAGVRGGGEEDVDGVGEEEGPEEGDGAEEEEDGEEQGHAEGVAEHDEGLETAFQGDVQRGPADAWMAVSRE